MTLSNVRVRNVATIGGALAHGDPHMDLPPVLMALGARFTMVSPAGERQLAVEELFSGYYETVLEKNELIAELHVPSQGSKQGWYSKVTTGSADDWPALGVAVLVDAIGDEIRSVRIVASAATDQGHATQISGGCLERQDPSMKGCWRRPRRPRPCRTAS